MDDRALIGVLIAAIGGLFAFIVWLVKVIVSITNKNTAAITQLSTTIGALPDAIVNKILMTPRGRK